jgi:excisionase family DNA binding protein
MRANGETAVPADRPNVSFGVEEPLEVGQLLDSEGAGHLLNVPASWVLSEARRGRIPHIRLGARYVRFDRDDLLGWVGSRKAGPRVTGSQPVSNGRDPL